MPGPSTSHPALQLRHLPWVCDWTGEGTGAALPLGWWQHMCHPCTWLPEGWHPCCWGGRAAEATL